MERLNITTKAVAWMQARSSPPFVKGGRGGILLRLTTERWLLHVIF